MSSVNSGGGNNAMNAMLFDSDDYCEIISLSFIKMPLHFY